MAIFSGQYNYKGYQVLFWLNPKSIKATVWDGATLVKKMWTTKDFNTLRLRVVKFIDRL